MYKPLLRPAERFRTPALLLSIGLLVTLAAQTAHGGAIYSTFNPPDGTGDSTQSAEHGYVIGSRFAAATTGTVKSYDFGFTAFSSSYVFDLRPDASGSPDFSAAALDHFTVTGASGYANQIFSGDSVLHPTLSAGTNYWLFVIAPSDSDLYWLYNTSGALNSRYYDSSNNSTNDGFVFTNANNLAYRVNGSAVPEPSSLLLLGVGALMAVGWGLRRRKPAKA